MSALPKFVFDGSISLSEYREQWLARFTELEGGFAKLKLVEGHVTADDFGLQLDRIYTGVGEFESRSRQFVKLHPSKEFRDEAETAAKAFAELEIRMELDPDLAKIILRMTYEETPSLPYQQVFVKRWQERVKRSGAALPEAQRAELAKLEKELTELRSQFSRNIADGEIKWAVSDEDLKGLPVDFVASRPRDESGKVLLTTSYVDYERIMNFAESDELRKATFLKFENIAYPANEAVFKRILEVTSKRAHLLGFKSHADYVLTGRNTLHGVQAVESFINDTQVRVTPRADKEKEVMAKVYGVDRLHPWQTLRAKNALARRLYDGFDASQIQEYLLTENVIPGITELIQEVFGIRFEHRPDVKSWVDKGVECYDVYDQDSSVLMGRIYTDLHPRDNKYSHACASELVVRRENGPPEAVLIANLMGGAEAQMTFNEVSTLYHEYGHIIHVLCATKSHFAELNSFSTETDFVEAPSQFLEQHLFEPRILKRFAFNKTGDCISNEMISKLKGMQELNKGMFTRTQLCFSRLALQYFEVDSSNGFSSDLRSVYEEICKSYGNYPITEGTHFHCRFGHLASSGYGPQYYCYLYAESIAMDFLQAFKSAPDGLLDRDMSRRYRRTILEAGSTKTAIEMCTDFLGRPPNADAFYEWVSSPLDLSALDQQAAK